MPAYYIDSLFILSIFLSIYISYLSLQLDFIGEKLFAGVSMSIILWLIGSGIEVHFAMSSILDIIGIQIHLIGSILAALFMFLFAVRYTTGFQFNRKQLSLLSTIPALNIILTLTNPWFNLMWTSKTQVEFFDILYTQFTFGPGIFIHAIYSYSLLILSIALFIRIIVLDEHPVSRQSILIITGISIPLLLSIIFVLGDVFPMNLTPFGLVVTQVLFLVAIYRSEFCYIVPGISHRSWDHISRSINAGVCITDKSGNILEVNKTLEDIMDISSSHSLIGENEKKVFEHFSEVNIGKPIVIELNGSHYKILKKEITDNEGEIIGYTYTLGDVTDQIITNQQVKLLNRFLRHNLRNSLSIINLSIERFSRLESTTKEDNELIETEIDRVSSQINRLSDMGSTINTVENSITKNQYVQESINNIIQRSIASFGSQLENVTIENEISDEYIVEVVSDYNIAIEHIIENSIKHNSKDGLKIRFSIESTDTEHITLKIEDNGQGIPKEDIESFNYELIIDENSDSIENDPLSHGTGIGFAVIHLLTTNSNGSIELSKSDHTGGALVKLTLPRAKRP